MSAEDFVSLPAGVQIAVAVMLWPAIWAGAQLAVALAGDVIRHAKTRTESGMDEVRSTR
jgi:hypothetical protein